jgi:RNA 2',3'-cyclic 3'-phosphodiesterase
MQIGKCIWHFAFGIFHFPMRLFIAIELDDQARHAIAAEQARLTASCHLDRSGLKWIRAEQLHLTLAFLGEVDDSRNQAVIEMMRPPISGNRFAVVFGGLGVFPPAGAPRVLWLRLTTGASEVIDVQRQVADRVARLGIPLEGRPFHPHLTLARWRVSRESDRRRVLDAASHHVTRLDVDAVALVRSHLSQAGAAHMVLCRTPLGDSGGLPLQSG